MQPQGKRYGFTAILTLLISFFCTLTAGASLIGNEITVNQETGVQQRPAIAFDGANYLVVWEDDRNGNSDIYAARVRASDGAVLDAGGYPVVTVTGNQRKPAVAFDGVNYLVVWEDDRNGNADIYAARVRASDGTVLDSGGFPVGAGAGRQQSPALTFDSTNFLVVWEDDRNGGLDIYGARVKAIDGLVLDSGGLGISTASGDQLSPSVSFDGTNYFVVWKDNRNGNPDIYAGRVRASDGLLIDVGGLAVTWEPGIQQRPSVAFDGTAYFWVVWEDYRSGNGDIYGVRMSTSGIRVDIDDRAISTASDNQTNPEIIFDGSLYSFVIWTDFRGDGITANIYGGRILSDGSILDGNGNLFSTTSSDKSNPAVGCDGVLCLSVWDSLGGVADSGIYAQRIGLPSLANLSPISAKIGDIVTINGINLGVDPGAGNRNNAQNHIELNGTILPEEFILSWSDISINVTIPSWANTGTITVVSSGMETNSLILTILPTILTGTLPTGVISTPYSSYMSAGGGVTPYQWSIVFGSFPPGITLNQNTGEIAGIPTAIGVFECTVQVEDGQGQMDTKVLSIIVDDLSPTAPMSVNIVPVNSHQIDLSWVPSTDDLGIVGYTVERTEVTTEGQFNLNFNIASDYQVSNPSKIGVNENAGGIRLIPEGLLMTKESGVRLSPSNLSTDYRGTSGPTIVRIAGGYRLYYVGLDTNFSVRRILSATSTDGVSFVREGTRLSPTSNSDDGDDILYPFVLPLDNGGYRLFYTGRSDKDGYWRILSAYSQDGLNFTKDSGRRVDVGISGSYDSSQTMGPAVIRLTDGRYRLYYAGYDSSSRYRILSAVSSTPGDSLNFIKEDGIRINLNNSIYDASGALSPYAVRHNDGRFRLYYIGVPSAGNYKYLLSAISTDGLNFTLESGRRLDAGTGYDINIIQISIMEIKNGIKVYYGGMDSYGVWRILSARMTDSSTSGEYVVAPVLAVDGITGWSGITATGVSLSSTTVFYQLSHDRGLTYKWWNGSAWATVQSASTYSGEGNDEATINAHINTFPVTQDGLQIRVWLKAASGGVSPLLDNIQVRYLLGNGFVEIARVSGTSYSDANLTAGTTYAYRVRAIDSTGHFSTYDDVISIWIPVLTIDTAKPQTGLLNVNYSDYISSSYGTKPYIWSIVAGSLPPGLNLDVLTGSISGMPSQTGIFNFRIQVVDAEGAIAARDLQIEIFQDTIILNLWEDDHQSLLLNTFTDSKLLSTASWNEFWWSGRAYPAVFGHTSNKSLPVMKFYGTVPNGTYEVRANLYGGTDRAYRYYYGFDAATPQAYSIDVSFQNDFAEKSLGQIIVSNGRIELFVQGADMVSGTNNYFGWAWIKLRLISSSTVAVKTDALPFALNGVSYQTGLVAEGGVVPYTWSITSGTLPDGLSLDNFSGIISGVPGTTGIFSFRVEVQDVTGQKAAKDLVISVSNNVEINTWDDSCQSIVLTTFTDSRSLTSLSWNEFWWTGRAYPAIFGHTSNKSLPVMRFYGTVPNGTYEIKANLYGGTDRAYRYYYGFDAANPKAYSIDVSFQNDFAERSLGQIIVTNGAFEIYVQSADILNGSNNYFGWAWVKLVYISSSTLVVNTSTLPNGFVSNNYSTNLSASGENPPFTWSIISGNLPAGIQLDGVTGTIYGNAMIGGTSNFVIQAEDTLGQTATKALSLEILDYLSINLTEDNHQTPFLTTFTKSSLLSTATWNEFWWSGRAYPAVFGHTSNKSLPVMKFYGNVPNGTYNVAANLYGATDRSYRYYYSYDPLRPADYSIDVSTQSDFKEHHLCNQVSVTNGEFALYVQRGDIISGGDNYFGWSSVKLYPASDAIINEISPSDIPNLEQNTLLVSGSGFIGVTKAYLDDPAQTQLSNLQVIDDTQIMVTVPAGVTTGTYNIQLVSSNGLSRFSCTARLTVKQAALEGYASKTSVIQGGSIDFYISGNVSSYDIHIYREGVVKTEVTMIQGLSATVYPVPADGYATGYKWPVAYTLNIPTTWKSGVYIAELSATNTVISRIIFVVREDNPGSTSKIVFKLSVNTYQAYSAAGGKSMYDGTAYSSDGIRSYKVSFDRPYKDIASVYMGGYLPPFDGIQGAGEFYYWEYHFVRWLEQNGYPVEYITDVDLHEDPGLLTQYEFLLSVGHDEYWSREMRDHVEAFIASGGNVAFFSGNVSWWQVRYEDNNRTMVCYKDYTKDPLYGIDNSRVTYLWAYYPVNRPENYMTGVSWRNGGFVNFYSDYPASRGYGGYTTYNTNHWVFQGTGLSNGQQFGQSETIVGYEVDGALFKWENGLPVATGTDGTPTNFTILGLSPSSFGYATMGLFERPGGGTVFTAATTDWVHGLATNPTVIQITSNILGRFTTSTPQGLRITSLSIPGATIGTYYEVQATAAGGVSPYYWQVAGLGLPPGITLDSSTGLLSGIPTATGDFSFILMVTDSTGEDNFTPLIVSVNTLPVITATTLPGGMTGSAYTSTASISGGTGPYIWSITNGTLPQGLSLNSTTGTISGVPIESGVFYFTIQVTDSYGVTDAQDVTLAISIGPPSILTTALPNGVISIPYETNLEVAGGQSPFLWSVTGGSLPAGISINQLTGGISGIPQAIETVSFTITVTDSSGKSASNGFSMTINTAIKINLWEDTVQYPVLTTFTDSSLLNISNWNEFLWTARNYPGVFGHTSNQSLQMMTFSAPVPNGIYTVSANLYSQPDMRFRYYYSFDSSNPVAQYVDTNFSNDFSERNLCTSVTVTDNKFQMYVQKGESIYGGDYYFGWSWVNLYPSSLPTPDSVSPSAGSNSISTDIVVTGNGFTGASTAYIRIPDTTTQFQLTNLVVVSDTMIRATVPSNMNPGTYYIIVATQSGKNQTSCATFTVYSSSTNYKIEGYASATSVSQGESINFHVSTDSPAYDIKIYREGANKELITVLTGLSGYLYSVPVNGYETGYNWPVAYTMQIPLSWKSGVYVAELKAGSTKSHIIFVVREDNPGSTSRIVFKSSVNTWQAYNDAGGKSLYNYRSSNNQRSYKVSFDRPYGNPQTGSDRMFTAEIGTGEFYDWEVHFIRWMETNGYTVEYMSDVDLHANPNILNGYRLMLSAGHDEYWSKEMRDNIDAFVAGGGNIAIFSGNVSWWQVRFEDNNRTMICYKDYSIDPLYGVDNSRVTYHWFGYPVNRPENTTIGVSFKNAGYVNYLGQFPSSQGYGDYIVYNSDHWIYEGTGLGDRDEFGLPEAIVGYEADGAEFVWVNGSPVPTGNDGTPTGFTILGISPAAPEDGGTGYATMGIFTVAGGGTVFNAATTDWSRALATNQTVARITRNVLNYLSGDPADIPLRIITTSFRDGIKDTYYNAPLAASGGSSPYQWSITSGQLPDGLILNASNGEISGTPVNLGTYNFTVRVVDTIGSYKDRAFFITIDENKTRYEENDLSLSYQGTWSVASDNSASNGSYRYSSDKATPARVTFTFTGSEVRWVSDIWWDLGIAYVYIDGVPAATVDLYSSANLYQQVVYKKTGLPPGTHTLTIEVTGTKNPSSGGTALDIDAFEVIP